MPLRVLLVCWGPYVVMCVYACFENVKVVSPKLRMVNIYSSLRFSFGFTPEKTLALTRMKPESDI